MVRKFPWQICAGMMAFGAVLVFLAWQMSVRPVAFVLKEQQADVWAYEDNLGHVLIRFEPLPAEKSINAKKHPGDRAYQVRWKEKRSRQDTFEKICRLTEIHHQERTGRGAQYQCAARLQEPTEDSFVYEIVVRE